MSGGNISITGVGNQPKAADVAVPQVQPAVEVAKPTAPAANGTPKTGSVDTYSQSQLREIAKNFGNAISIINSGIRFQIDETNNEVITQIIDKDTNKVIRQIPPQELINVSHRLRQFLGALLDLKS